MSSEYFEREQMPQFPESQRIVEQDHLKRVAAPASRRQLVRNIMIASSLVATPPTIALASVAQNEWLFTGDSEGTIIEDVDGCEPFTKSDVLEDGSIVFEAGSNGMYSDQMKLATLLVELEHKKTVSAAENFEADRFELHKAIKQWAEVLRHRQLAFTSEISGLRIHLYSDRTDAFASVDTKALDRLTHAILDPSIDYPHVGMQEFVDCMYWRFIDQNGPRELEDVDLNIYIPSQRGICFRNGILQNKPERHSEGFCDSVGGTKSEIAFAIPPFFHKKSDWSIVIGTRHDKEDAEAQISRHLLHELSGHYLLQRAGQAFKWDANEAASQEYEEQAYQQLFGDGSLPIVIRYND